MTLLLIDTAFDTCQAGVWRDGALLAARSLPGEARHDVMLAPLVAGLLHDQSLSVRDLTGVAVVTGPGRFTSLRVGIAFARALVLPHAIPLVGLATGAILHRRHSDAAQTGWLVMVKRGEVFAQIPGQDVPVTLALDAVAAWLDRHAIAHLTVIGAGVPTLWDSVLPAGVTTDILTSLPLAVMGSLAEEAAAHAPSPLPVRPFYGTSTGAWDLAPPPLNRIS